MFQPNESIAVTMTAAEWNQVLAALAEGPFKIVMPLIQKINEQAMKQDGGGLVAQDQTTHVPH
jgi:hypothetical protein